MIGLPPWAAGQKGESMGTEDRIKECYEHYEADPEVIRMHHAVLEALDAYTAKAVKDAFLQGYKYGRGDRDGSGEKIY